MVQTRMQNQVLQHGQFCVQRKRLRHIAHLAAGFNIATVDLLPKQPSLAFTGRQQARQDFHGGGFTAAIRAQKAKNLPTAYLKIHMVYGRKIAKAYGQILRLDGIGFVFIHLQGRNVYGLVVLLFFSWQQLDVSRLQIAASHSTKQFFWRACGQYLARIHHHQPVKCLRFVHVSRGHHHTHVRSVHAYALYQIPKLRAGQRVYAGGGLIQNQQVGVVYQGAAQAQLLLHAT